jgi:lysyl endopeptidase
MKRQILFFIIIIFHFNVFQLYSQISCGGSPLSFRKQLKSTLDIPLFNLPEVNHEALVNEDIGRDLAYQCESRIAKGFRVDISPGKNGLWEMLPDGGRLWRIRILSKGARAIHIMFDQYMLPEGAELFLYNKDRSQILGAFGWENNQNSGILAITPIRGEEIIIEYFEPADVSFNGILHIGNIGHNYKDNTLTDSDGFGDSEACNKDVNCEAAADWQFQKRSVCMIVFMKTDQNYYLCSGALINNARNNGVPYLLTANHCLPTYYEAQTAVYYFNYESPECNGPDGDLSQTISGSVIKATTYQLDFCLVQLSSAPPLSYKPYYSGWDITTKAPKKSVCIHHPLGDVKKIAFYNAAAITGDFIYLYDFDDSTHWYIEDWHYGITQGGSSGSPLYNEDHRIVGDLTGGSTIANCTSADAYFAKICRSWADYTSLARLQLKAWLDPDATGVTFIDGYEPTSTQVDKINSNYEYVRVYPNPSDGIISVELQHQFTSPVTLNIINLTGRVLLTSTISSMERISQLDLSGYYPGIYLLEVQSAGFLTTQKIILE